MKRRFWSSGLVAVSLLFYATEQTHASIDLDENRLPDIWQKHFSPEGGAEEDDDGDGANNLAEAEAGTNPNDSDSVFRIQGCHWNADDDSVCVEWKAVRGKAYRVEARCLLTENDRGWIELGRYEHRESDGAVELTLVEPPGTSIFANGRCFLRIGVEDQDQDRDGLSDWEEGVVGTDAFGDDAEGDLQTAMAWLGEEVSEENDEGENDEDSEEHDDFNDEEGDEDSDEHDEGEDDEDSEEHDDFDDEEGDEDSGEHDEDDEEAEDDEGSGDDSIEENGFPILLANEIAVSQGEVRVLEASDLFATDPNDRDDRLVYAVTEVQQGRFESVDSGAEVSSFSQADLNARRIRFAQDGSDIAPSYKVSVSDGERMTGPVAGAISFRSQSDQNRPVITRNGFDVIQGESVVLRPSDVDVSQSAIGAGSLTYAVSELVGGHFEHVSSPGVALVGWEQSQLESGSVRFVHDGSQQAPSYRLAVSDDRGSSLASLGEIRFYPNSGTGVAPSIIANSLTARVDDRIVLSLAHLAALDPDSMVEDLIYQVSDVNGGQFERSTASGTSIVQFSQAEINQGQVVFVHDGTLLAPAYNVWVSDGVNRSEVMAASVSFCDGSRTSMMTEKEMAAFNKLAPLTAVTHTVVNSGRWSNPAVWDGGRLPGEGARVYVPEGKAVVIDKVLSPALDTIRIDGMLRFAPDIDTRLRVDTIVSFHCSRFEVGTSQIPIATDVTAEITFADDGPIDTSIDFAQMGRGAVLHGETVIFGAERTSRQILAGGAIAGATALQLLDSPIGWQVGDELVVTGTIPNVPVSDERRQIAWVDGLSIGLDRPLEIDHLAPRSDLNVYVANVTRNVIFRSENPVVARRGHIMFMHTLRANVNYARFFQLGRTDKTRRLDDVIFEFGEDQPGNNSSGPIHFTSSAGPRTNIRGRYPIHLHRGGIDPASDPAVIKGSVVMDSPGWGFVTHSAHARFVDNVSYAVQGTGFYTEAGDEIGEMVGNTAIRSVNSSFVYDSLGGAIDPDLGFEEQEFGNDGDGFWLSGHMVAMRNNVAAGSSAHGIIYWSDGLVEADIPRGRTSVKVSDIQNGHLIPNRETIPTWWAPLAEVSGNECYGSSVGFRVRYLHAQTYMGEGGSPFHASPPQAYIDSLEPVIEGLTVWGNRDGVLLNYTERVSLKNALIVGIGAPFVLDGGTANSGMGLDLGTEVTRGFGRVENVTIEGFEMGYVVPRNDQWVFEDLTLRNLTDMLIAEPRQGPRTITMNRIEFGGLDGTAVAGRSGRRNILLMADLDYTGFQPYWFVMPDRLTLDGQGIYYNEQAANVVPLTQSMEDLLERVPQEYFNKSNQELQNQFGLSYGGVIPPADARAVPYVSGGIVGTRAPASTRFPRLLDMTNGGESPEPAKGGPNPELTRNLLTVRQGQSVTLMATNLNTTDTDTSIADLVYQVSDVERGRFAHRDAPEIPIMRFTQAQINGGVIRFIHDNSSGAPSYRVSVSDGSESDGPSPGTVRFE